MFGNNNNKNSISISISDDLDPSRLKRKRKKQQQHHKNFQTNFPKRIVQFLVKYWTLLIIIPAFALLLYEASRLGIKPSLIGEGSNVGKKAVENNLDRIDPVTRIVRGIRERCLDLLPPEELQHLDIPESNQPDSPVKEVLYISETGAQHEGGSINISQHDSDGTRFNLFTGFQTLDQREQSFKVNESTLLHCGFYRDDGGFIISNDDRNYMQSCKVVVSTCAFGGGDNLYQPIGMSEVCYVAFWDEITLDSQRSRKQKVGEKGFIGKWRIIVVRNLPFSDQRLNGKIPKMLSHRLFPQARYFIWVDSKSQFRRDPLGVLEALLWRTNSVLAISEHGARSSVYDESKAIVKKNKATPEEVEVQITQYRKDGLPEEKRLNGKKALAEASVLVREQTPLTNMLMCLWFNEVVRFTSRDQLSFPYVLWQLGVLKNINMFPVCTRKDLVNSIGHVRKAKPLIH